MKYHDSHTLMQQILQVVICDMLSKDVINTTIKFCEFFNGICKKSIEENKLQQMQRNVALKFCKLEKYFPNSFFYIMVQLIIYVTWEIKLCSPIYLRWMYLFQMKMKIKVLKGYVKNMNHSKGCIVECYMTEETIVFFS